jgi:hypothetical protein
MLCEPDVSDRGYGLSREPRRRHCPKFVYRFRTGPCGLPRNVPTCTDLRPTHQAALTNQLRIPSLTPSHEICPVFSMICSTG